MCLTAKTKNTSTGMTASGPDLWAQAAGQQNYNKAKKLVNAPGANVAPQEAFTGLGADYDKASSMANSMADSTNSDYSTARSGFSALQGADDPTKTVADYMNPFIAQVLAPQIRQMMEQGQLARNQINAQAAMDGAFGDSRSGIELAQQLRDEQQNISDTTGKAYAAAFDQATGARAAALQRLMAVAQAQEGLGTAEDQRKAGIAQLLAALAGQKQTVDQQGNQISYNNAVAQKQLPYQNLAYLMSMLNQAPKATIGNSTTNSTQSAPDNTLLQLAGKIATAPSGT